MSPTYTCRASARTKHTHILGLTMQTNDSMEACHEEFHENTTTSSLMNLEDSGIATMIYLFERIIHWFLVIFQSVSEIRVPFELSILFAALIPNGSHNLRRFSYSASSFTMHRYSIFHLVTSQHLTNIPERGSVESIEFVQTLSEPGITTNISDLILFSLALIFDIRFAYSFKVFQYNCIVGFVASSVRYVVLFYIATFTNISTTFFNIYNSFKTKTISSHSSPISSHRCLTSSYREFRRRARSIMALCWKYKLSCVWTAHLAAEKSSSENMNMTDRS